MRGLSYISPISCQNGAELVINCDERSIKAFECLDSELLQFGSLWSFSHFFSATNSIQGAERKKRPKLEVCLR